MSPRSLLLIALLVSALAGGFVVRAPFAYEDANWRGVLATRHVASWTLPGRELTMQTYRLTPTPASAHLLNVAIHLVNGWLVYLIGAALLDPAAGAIAAMLFLLHPLSSEAIAYVTARTDLLLTTWMLLAIWMALQAIDKGGAWRLFLAFVSVIAAAMTKEIGVLALPVALWTVMIWRGDRPRAQFITAAGLVLAGLLGGLSVTAVQHADLSRVGLQIADMWRILGLIWPFGFSLDHDALGLRWFVPYAVALSIWAFGMSCLGWLEGERLRILPWAFGVLALVVGPRILIDSPEFLSEHWLYPALPAIWIGLAALATWPRVIVQPGKTYWRLHGQLTEAHL